MIDSSSVIELILASWMWFGKEEWIGRSDKKKKKKSKFKLVVLEGKFKSE